MSFITRLSQQNAGHIRNGMTAANIREQYDNFDVVYWDEQVTLTGNQTIDLSELVSKSTFILPSGKPTLITDASTALIVGDAPNDEGDFGTLTHAPHFYGDFWIYASGSRAHGTRAVKVNANTYRLHFDQLWTQNWGGGIQGTRGEIKTLTIDRFFAWDFVAFGAEFYSDDYLKEVSEIFINGMTEGNTSEGGAEGIFFSWGTGVGSAGKIGAVVRNGVCYRQKSVAKHWAVREINSASWSNGVTTYTLEDYHSLPVGGNVTIGGFDNANYNNTSSTPWTAASGTDGKVIKVAMSDPGSYTATGWFSYNYRVVPAAYNDFERPRKISYYDLSGRGQRGKVFDTRAGGNIVWKRCIADDGGVSDPNGLTATGSWSSSGGGTVTYVCYTDDTLTTTADHELSVGDYFNIRYMNPSGYNASLQAVTVPNSYTVTAAMVDDPGTMLSPGNYYKPITLTSDGWYFGENAGCYNIEDCEAHENYRSAVYDERMTNERAVISNNRFFNSTYGLPDPPTAVADIYMRPGRANMTITGNILGAGDTWRFASKSFVFSSVPSDGDYVGLKLDADTETTYFIFTTEEDNDSSQPSVLIATGGTAAENLENTIINLRDAIHARDDANCRGVMASERDSNLTQTGTIDRLLLVRTVPGAVGKDYTLEDGSSVISLSPSGTSLAGGTGNATANYGIMNVRDGERGNVVQNNQMESHTDGETNMDPVAEAPAIRVNLLDNGDFSLDQANEGASVSITSAGTGARIVDRWFATRSGSNVTGQRVAGSEQTYGLKITGAASNTAVVVTQRLEGSRTANLEGKVCVMSAWLYGTGVTRAFMRVATADVLDTFSAVTTIKNRQFVINSTPQRVYFTFLGTAAIDKGLEISFRFTSGVGSGQSVTIEGAKLEESGLLTDFVPDIPEDNLFSCQRYYRKSFASGTAPAQNAGTTGAVVGTQAIAGAVSQQAAAVDLNPPMRTSPTVTLYNPSAANAQIRNTTAGADWASSTSTPSTTSISIRGTGPGGGAAGDAAAVHYVADADFP